MHVLSLTYKDYNLIISAKETNVIPLKFLVNEQTTHRTGITFLYCDMIYEIENDIAQQKHNKDKTEILRVISVPLLTYGCKTLHSVHANG